MRFALSRRRTGTARAAAATTTTIRVVGDLRLEAEQRLMVAPGDEERVAAPASGRRATRRGGEPGAGSIAARRASSSARNVAICAGVSVVELDVDPPLDDQESTPTRVSRTIISDEPLCPKSAGSGANSSSSIHCTSSGGASSTAWIGGASATRAAGAAGAPERLAIAPHPARTSTATRPARSLTRLSLDPGSAEQHVESERQPGRQFTELVEREQHTGCE